MLKRLFQHRLLPVIVILCSYNANAQITAIDDTAWSLASTWDLGRKPISTDIVIINGRQVTLDISAEVSEIRLSNANGATAALNVVGGGKVLTVTGNMSIESSKEAFDLDFNIENTDSVYIGGNLSILRPSTNSNSNRTSLNLIGHSKLTVNGNLSYQYNGSDVSELNDDINLTGSSTLKVKGNTSLNVAGGDDFTFHIGQSSSASFIGSLVINMSGANIAQIELEDNAIVGVTESISINNTSGTAGSQALIYVGNTGGDLTIRQDLNIYTNSADAISRANINGTGASFRINRNINMNAIDEGDVGVFIQSGGMMFLGGNINRSTINDYGIFSMDNDTKLYFTGSNPQLIPESDKPSNGTDSFNFSSIYFENTSSTPSITEGEITISKELILVNGIIQTTESAPLVILDEATISGGNSSSYIDGPIIKRGKTTEASFIFPLGNNGKYAPIGIEQISNTSVEYTAQYIGCPPPIGIQDSAIKGINQSGYWTLARPDGISVGNITLYWESAIQSGITDTTSLEVAYYSAGTGWKSIGRSNSSENVTQTKGKITNNIGCPPPIGIQTFGFASTSEKENFLPVELLNFDAYTTNDSKEVILEWETASEENSDIFIVQKSYNGVTYEEVARIPAAGNSSYLRSYNTVDTNPGKGNNYYRIIQVDIDQTMMFSRLINVFIHLKDTDQPIIYPNPVQDHLKLYSSDFTNNEKIGIMVFDASGKSIYRKYNSVNDGQIVLLTKDLNIIDPGIYFISYVHNGAAYTLELIKSP